MLNTLVSANPLGDVAAPDRCRRIALLVSGSHDTWSYLLKYLKADTSLNVCLVVMDDPKWIGVLSRVSSATPWCVMNPAHYTPQRRIRIHKKQPPAGFDTDLAEAIAEARAHVVVACEWPHKPGPIFWHMALVPPLLTVPDVPLAVLRLDKGRSGISLSSASRRAPPSVLLEHAFSVEELDSSSLRAERCHEFAANAALRVGKLPHSQAE
ncbi:hypothetical protein AURDEDRAFT_145991 [Auricularia subglabra TFB-10046 SS5]|nr:hypothetical protein AURDEDRAFT_145991 [Auricularia subglabra TFB-10046 SS5]